MTTIRGTAGDDNLTGTSGNDNILVFQGGDDTVQAGGGNDIIRLGATLTAADKIDGGTGHDVMILNGDYSAGVVFNANTMTNVEVLSLVGGHSYNLTLNDGNVAAGAGLLVKAGSLGSGDSLIFDGSAETDGQLAVVGGAGDDTVTGGAQGDHFRMEKGGVDTVNGGGGNDVFYMGDQLWSDDQIDGGSGYNVVHATGFSGGDTLTLTGTTLQNVEDFILDGGSFLAVITADGTVAAGATMTIDASAQTTAFLFDGSAETDGSFNVIGGSGDDNLTGGAGADTFHLELGGVDTASGGGGNDRFFMGASLTAADQIEGGAGFDTVYVNGATAVTFTATTITDIEKIVLGAGHSYNFIENDANVAAGQSLTIDASALGAGNRLQFHGDAETDGTFTFIGGAGDDQISGGSGGDRFHLENGGNDTAFGGGGNDHFYMGASLTAADRIVGGSGYDTVILNGGAPVTFSATTMTGVEQIDLTAGHSYSLTTNNATVGFNQLLTIDGSSLGAGDTLTFNGAAETNGSFDVIGGAGNDVITGGKWGDFIDLSFGGNDTVTLGRGLNSVYFGAALTAADQVNGSAGHFDQVILEGDYTGANAVVFNATTMVNIDDLVVLPGFSYDLTTNDGNLGANQGMEVDGFFLGAGDSLKFDGSAETNGFFILNDGAGNDVLKGGARGDFLSSLAGAVTISSMPAGISTLPTISTAAPASIPSS
jgi:Ca2+-binding RTX toxin-like protein